MRGQTTMIWDAIASASNNLPPQPLLNDNDPMHVRVKTYMSNVARRDGYEISFEITPDNTTLMQGLWMAITEQADERVIKTMCDALAPLCRKQYLQGIRQMTAVTEEQARVFRIPGALVVSDRRYVPPASRGPIELSYTVSADDDQVLKQQPGVQPKLWEE